jgi:uncharacterized protein YndB with AHSA1/START domain
MNETATVTSTQNSVIHSTFSIERIYPHTPGRVFFAHADQAMKRRWFAEGDGWSIDEYKLDFRLDGSEVSRFRYQDSPEVRYDAAFYDGSTHRLRVQDGDRIQAALGLAQHD